MSESIGFGELASRLALTGQRRTLAASFDVWLLARPSGLAADLAVLGARCSSLPPPPLQPCTAHRLLSSRRQPDERTPHTRLSVS